MPSIDYSWSETALYACRCGQMYPAQRWRWIDADARPSVLARVRRFGPWEGTCPSCNADAGGHGGWVCIRAGERRAELVLDPSRRGDLLDELRAHLGRVGQQTQAMPTWVCTPQARFTPLERSDVAAREETTARRSFPTVPARAETESPRRPAASVPSTRVEREVRLVQASAQSAADMDDAELPAPVTRRGPTSPRIPSPRRDDPDAGVPQIIGSDSPSPGVPSAPASIGAHVADLTMDEAVSCRVRLAPEEMAQWETASLVARPIHLRNRGYPLVGVRIVGSFMGQVGCIDAVVDVGSTLATDVFRRLSERFEVCLRSSAGSREISRTITAEGLEPNAALCIESARGILARGEYPPREFDKARQTLEAEPAAVRLAPGALTIARGAYQHIIGAREAVSALEHLERVSQKDALARLLEVDGLPMAEYDDIRRRVLEGSLVHGLCAPRRFWRRLVASGLARDLEDYVQRLCANRAEFEGTEGDLEPDAAREAWVAIYNLCSRKDISAPPQLRQALDLPEPTPIPEPGPPPPPRRATSGEIRSRETRSTDAPPTTTAGAGDQLGARLRDPQQRLRAATEVLQGRASTEDLGQVIGALEEFETSELLALLPDLNDLGLRAVPGLMAKLQSDRREVRQAAAILLGMSREPGAMECLAEHLVREPTTMWLDVARALGWFGTAAIRSLLQVLRAEGSTPRESLAIDRISRALAEIAVAQDSGAETQTGRDAVRALADAADPRVSTAARRAMASLAEVTASGAQIRGEIPLSEVTEIRAFARRAYEAIMVPELEVEAEA